MANYIETYENLNKTLTGINRLGWNSKTEQWMRFHAITKLINKHVGALTDLTIHDVGCGFADLLTHWADTPPKQYIGTDCIRSFVNEAQSRHPTADIRLLDSLKQTPPTVDVSVMCGTLSMHKSMQQIVMLDKIYASSRKAVIITMWTGPSQGENWWKMERHLLSEFGRDRRMVRNEDLYDMSENMFILLK